MIKHVLDAKNKKLGRIASEAASILMGKNTPQFAKNVAPEVEVEIINASKTDINEKKKLDKTYITYSGHPGGQKEEELGKLIERKGIAEVYKRAVYGMLPDNKLRARAMTKLTVTE
ncbi:MAG: 50S ribosomal protein L13 [Patescibacteria group bacterium]